MSRATFPRSPRLALLRGVSLLFLASAWGVLALACSGGDRAPGSARGTAADAPRERWSLSEAPLLEIGVREGEEPYQLHRAQSAVRLDDGRIVVLNGGSQELRFFGPDGRFLFAVGREGEGPGELRYPTWLRKAGADSLLVWDQGMARVSFFNESGEFLGSRALLPTPEILFPGDEWILGSFWIDSPVRPEARGPIREAARTIPLPDSLAGLVFLKVTGQGRIWVSEVRPPADSALTWTVYDLKGGPVAEVTTPRRFTPFEIGPDYVVGRSTDEMDINYIRVYGLEKPAGSRPGPGLDPSPPAVVPQPKVALSPEEQEVLAPLKDTMKKVATLEEIYYSEHYTYTSDTGELFSDPRIPVPHDLETTIFFAGGEGWMGRVTDPGSGRFCVLSYGSYVPMGWTPGMVICP